MKHLNANLDNVTNVELKVVPTGGIRAIGVDADGDIVEASASSNSDGSIDILSSVHTIVMSADGTTGYYFDGNETDFDPNCWAMGSEVILSVQETPTPTGEYANHVGVEIRGVISKIEATASGDVGTAAITSRRVYVTGVSSIGTADAFDGRADFGGIVGSYTIATGDGGMYCITPTSCLIESDTPPVLFLDDSDIRNTEDATEGGVGGLVAWSGAGNISFAPGDTVIQASRGQNYDDIYVRGATWGRFYFWGYDTEPDGSTVVHPDTGLPAIVVSEISNVPQTPFGEYQIVANPIETNIRHEGNRNTLSRIPDPTDALTRTGVDGNPLMIRQGTSNNYAVRGGTPYQNNPVLGAVDPFLQISSWFDGDSDVTFGWGISPDSFQPQEFWGGAHPNMGDVSQAGPMPLPNTTGDKQPSGMFADPSHSAKPYMVIGPPSANTGMNYRNPYTPGFRPLTQGAINITHGTEMGYSPLFSVVSGSGAVRASDGRYYLNATPNPAEDQGTYDVTLPGAVDDGFYVNGNYVAGGNGLVRDASWTVKLDRAVYEVGNWTEFRGANGSVSGQTHEILKTYGRQQYSPPPTPIKEPGDDLFGYDTVMPEDPPEETAPPATNVQAYTRVTTGTQRADAEEAQAELRFVAGENITIEVANGDPDTVTISATDEAEVTEITNLIDGSDIIDVSSAATTNHITIPPGDIAYVSAFELWYNNTGADIIVNDTPANFQFGKVRQEDYTIVAIDPDITAGVDITSISTHVSVDAGEAIQVGNIIHVNTSGSGVVVDQPTGSFNFATSFTSRTIGSGECMLRIGGETETTRVDSVINVSAASTTNGILVPSSSVAWISATEQYWNTSGLNLIVISPLVSEFSDTDLWLKIGDGVTPQEDSEFLTITVDDTTSNDVVAEQHGDTLNLRGGTGITLASTPLTDTITISANRTVREATITENIDTTTTAQTLIIDATNQNDGTPFHGLAGNNFTVQVFEEMTGGDYSLVLPDTLIIRTTGNIEISFPQNTINGNVKIEIRA